MNTNTQLNYVLHKMFSDRDYKKKKKIVRSNLKRRQFV